MAVTVEYDYITHTHIYTGCGKKGDP